MKELLLYLLVAFFFSPALARYSCPDEDGKIFETIDLEGDCPTITRIVNLNVSRITGAFYRKYTNSWGLPAGCEGCITTYVARVEDDLYRSTSCCRTGCTINCAGTVGGTTVSLNDGVFHNDELGIDVYVLDYDGNYYVLYTCSINEDGSIATEGIAVRTRFPTINWPLKNKIFQIIRGNNLDVGTIQEVYQGDDCPYSYFN